MEDGRDETDKERLDRNLNEMLGGLRVIMPGVQVLFAFLLVVPFNQRFTSITGFERGVYFVTLIATGVATALLIAPGAIHRIEFRADDKHWIVFTGNKLVVLGFVAVTSAVLFVTHFAYSDGLSIAATVLVGSLIVGLWYVLPLSRRRGVVKPPEGRRNDA
jgi:hypothetical protein